MRGKLGRYSALEYKRQYVILTLTAWYYRELHVADNKATKKNTRRINYGKQDIYD